jgi:ribosomal protein S18 acetylase RimI-like enzyme
VTLRNAVAQHLTDGYGHGHWSGQVTQRRMVADMRHKGTTLVARAGAEVVATLRLVTKKPWAIDRTVFSPSRRPLYLIDMAVAPAFQRQGLGRRCLEEAVRFAQAFPADAIRLDAYDAEAGAGGFYAKCGFREVGRATYRGTPLVYFELVL